MAGNDKDKVLNDASLHTLGEIRDVEDDSVGTNASPTPRDVQAGVKNIEAVSMAWRKWGLIISYARYI